MDRKQREAELHEIVAGQGGNAELRSILVKHTRGGGEIDQGFVGTPLVDAILDHEYPPDKSKVAGDQKFEDPPGAEAPGG